MQDLNVVLSYPTFTVGIKGLSHDNDAMSSCLLFCHTDDDDTFGSDETLMDEEVWLQHLVFYKFLDSLTIYCSLRL